MPLLDSFGMVSPTPAVAPECAYPFQFSASREAQENSLRKSSRFTDKFVKLVVARPCLIFCVILSLCSIITIVLFNKVFSQGMPFTPDNYTYDLQDARSRAYDSLRLAYDNVTLTFELANSEVSKVVGGTKEEDTPPRLQDNLADVTYWIFESKTETGLFTKEGLSHMRSVEDMFLQDSKYTKYCLLDYSNEAIPQCHRPMSPTNIFYASKWNSTLAIEIMSELTSENIQMFNDLAACVQKSSLCDFVPVSSTNEDKAWVRSIGMKIAIMIMDWDGEGGLNQDVDEVSALIASLSELYVVAPFVSFFFDRNFEISNPVTAYSRSIIYWGSPLNGTQDSSSESSRDLLKR